MNNRGSLNPANRRYSNFSNIPVKYVNMNGVTRTPNSNPVNSQQQRKETLSNGVFGNTSPQVISGSVSPTQTGTTGQPAMVSIGNAIQSNISNSTANIRPTSSSGHTNFPEQYKSPDIQPNPNPNPEPQLISPASKYDRTTTSAKYFGPQQPEQPGWSLGSKFIVIAAIVVVLLIILTVIYFVVDSDEDTSNINTANVNTAPLTKGEASGTYAEIEHEHSELCIGPTCTDNSHAIDVLHGRRDLIVDCSIRFPLESEKEELEQQIEKLESMLELIESEATESTQPS